MKNIFNHQRTALQILGVLCALGTAPAALAQTSGSGMTPSKANELQGATTGLGTTHRFATIDAARNQCADDTIVWGSGITLTYILPGSPGYGQTQPGFYACKMEADTSGFAPAN